ncbi:MAG: SurA N-terminal domain-containing protein [Myxococcales bacterium]|nr:SurA N-terminal domain-containing protein [Myxococcales bacterium]
MTARRTSSLQFACGLLVMTVAGGSIPAHAEVIERVVAVVNDEAVFLSELRRRAAPFLASVVADASPGERRERVNALYNNLLNQLVDEVLIEQTAQELKLTVSSLEVDQAIDNVRRSNGLSDEQFWEAVGEQGFTRAQYRQDVRKQLLRLKVINQKVRTRVNISEGQVREEYDKRLRQARRSQRFRAAHVLYALPEGASATEVKKAMSAASEMRVRLTADNFIAQAEAHGGGELGWLDQGDLPTSLETTLLDLEPGQISAPVRGPAGVHLFLLQERQAQATQMPTFAASRATIQQELLAKAMQRQEGIFLSELRKNAVIDRRI